MALKSAKQVLRKEIKRRVAALSNEEKLRQSTVVTQKVCEYTSVISSLDYNLYPLQKYLNSQKLRAIIQVNYIEKHGFLICGEIPQRLCVEWGLRKLHIRSDLYFSCLLCLSTRTVRGCQYSSACQMKSEQKTYSGWCPKCSWKVIMILTVDYGEVYSTSTTHT